MSDCSSDDSNDVPDPRVALLGQNFATFTHDGNFSVYFKLVHNRREAEEDIRNDTFFPDFVHQFFIDKERIFGYKKPVLRLFYTASRLKRYVKFDYEDKLSREKDGIEPDDVLGYLKSILEDLEYTQDLNQFINDVENKEEAEFRPPGDLLYEFENSYKKPNHLSRAQLEQLAVGGENLSNGNSQSNGHSHSGTNGTSSIQSVSRPAPVTTNRADDRTPPDCQKKYQIFHANSDTKNFNTFQARMQTLIMWFIESATMIDHEDPRWDFFLVFEKFNPSTSEDPQAPSVTTEDRYYFVGYATVYRYYAYPDRTRPRVSQMLILPPYRRNGVGTTLLQSIYDYYKKQPATLDITAEDPDEEFIAMRDLLDCKNCSELSTFQPDKLNQGWSEELAKEAQDKLRLCHRQARKVYEILKLRSVDPSDDEASTKYRLEVKNRLNVPFRKLRLDCAKLEKRGIPLDDKVQTQVGNLRLAAATLEENYQELARQYKHTIEKLNQVRH